MLNFTYFQNNCFPHHLQIKELRFTEVKLAVQGQHTASLWKRQSGSWVPKHCSSNNLVKDQREDYLKKRADLILESGYRDTWRERGEETDGLGRKPTFSNYLITNTQVRKGIRGDRKGKYKTRWQLRGKTGQGLRVLLPMRQLKGKSEWSTKKLWAQ